MKKAGIVIAALKQPVTFTQMGTDDETVEVSRVFMLAMVDPNVHIDKLQRIVEMIQDKEMIEKLMKADAPEEKIQMIREKEKTL